MFEFNRTRRLPPYVFAIVNNLKMDARRKGEDIIDLGRVAVSPGIGFGEGGDNYVRFALVENEHRIRQAAAGIKRVLNK